MKRSWNPVIATDPTSSEGYLISSRPKGYHGYSEDKALVQGVIPQEMLSMTPTEQSQLALRELKRNMERILKEQPSSTEQNTTRHHSALSDHRIQPNSLSHLGTRWSPDPMKNNCFDGSLSDSLPWSLEPTPVNFAEEVVNPRPEKQSKCTSSGPDWSATVLKNMFQAKARDPQSYATSQNERKDTKIQKDTPTLKSNGTKDYQETPSTMAGQTQLKRKVSQDGSGLTGSSSKPRRKRKSHFQRSIRFPSLDGCSSIQERLAALPPTALSPSLMVAVLSKAHNSSARNKQRMSTPPRHGDGVSPSQTFRRILRDRGHDESYAMALDGVQVFNLVPSALQLASYGTSLVWAVHTSNVEHLRQLLSCGLSPNPCNQFKDSILSHMVCKHGRVAIYRCLVEEFHADLHILDGFGRTPLHYCCWANEFCRTIVEDILKKDPVQIFVKDTQGKLPLDYVDPKNWGVWNQFLEEIAEEHWPRGKDLPRAQKQPRSKAKESPLTPELAAQVASGQLPPSDLQIQLTFREPSAQK